MTQEQIEERVCETLGWDYEYWVKFHSKDEFSAVYLEIQAGICCYKAALKDLEDAN